MSPEILCQGNHSKNIQALQLRYDVARHATGWVLCAQQQQRLCAVMLAPTREKLLHELTTRFAGAAVTAAPMQRTAAMDYVLALIDGTAGRQTWPLLLLGTPFQCRVWQALLTLQRGETTTYGALARSLGSPNGARAVGSACGKNSLAVVVPCHRVLHGGQQPLRYRWGAALKERLLAQERPAAL